jgi:hypothetical protein
VNAKGIIESKNGNKKEKKQMWARCPASSVQSSDEEKSTHIL